MSLVINTNMSSIDAQRNLWATGQDLSVAMQRLSSGLRINSAKDDAAGYAIATNMTSQINGVGQAINNSNNANNMIQTSLGGMNQIQSILQRMNELAVEANDGTNAATSTLGDLDKEYQQLLSEVDRISSQTTFNGTTVLSGAGTITFQIGANSGNTMAVAFADATTASGSLSISGTALDTTTNAATALNDVAYALTSIGANEAKMGAYSNALDFQVSNLQSESENTTSARSAIVDADFAAESAQMTKDMVLQQAGISVLAQANQEPQMILKLLQ